MTFIIPIGFHSLCLMCNFGSWVGAALCWRFSHVSAHISLTIFRAKEVERVCDPICRFCNVRRDGLWSVILWEAMGSYIKFSQWSKCGCVEFHAIQWEGVLCLRRKCGGKEKKMFIHLNGWSCEGVCLLKCRPRWCFGSKCWCFTVLLVCSIWCYI